MSKKRPLILITDDEEMITRIFEDGLYLEMKDKVEIEVTEVPNEAIRLTSTIKYDVLLLDHRMPSMKGSDVAHKIRKKSGPNQKTPIIFISGYIRETKLETEGLEDIYYLPKPLIFKDLSEIIKKIMN